LPVQSLSIANTLNGTADSHTYFDSSVRGANIRFIIPDARILVVDDIATNLKVVDGLLAPYKAKVDLCLRGIDAIEMIKNRDYDLVFMDHMMPEMDGIETTEVIRAWEKEQALLPITYSPIPIVALTANAVTGMREVFLGKGFNDFLAKPIDVSKLDEILDRWIPKDKREERKEKIEKKLVLLADENLANLRLGRNALKEKYNVITAPSEEKMLNLLESNSPDIILLGAGMMQPDTSAKLSSDPKSLLADIPVILIPEPFNATELIACIERELQT
jgi:CheY-like chemotaxis protein